MSEKVESSEPSEDAAVNEENSLNQAIMKKITDGISIQENVSLILNKAVIVNDYWNSSLFSLITSDKFTIDDAICLLTSRNQKGIIDELINVISSKYINESFFYLPQLMILFCSKKDSKSIETFLLERCINQIKFSIIINWLVASCKEDNKILGLECKKYEKLENRIEMTLVNGKRCTLGAHALYTSTKAGASQSEIFNFSLNKQLRLDYYNSVIKFYQDFKNLCEKLKTFPKDPLTPGDKNYRNAVLRRELAKMDKNIKAMYKKAKLGDGKLFDLEYLFHGIILPFDDVGSADDDWNSIIVSILPQYSMCFSTKARVPIKIVVESIRGVECKEWDKKYIHEKEEEEGKDKDKDKDKEEGANEVSDNVNGFEVIESKKRSNTTVIFGSVTEFMERTERENKERQIREQELKNQEEIKKILSQVDYANKHPEEEDKLEIFKQRLSISSISHSQEFLGESTPLDKNPFGDKWINTINKIKENSPYRNFETYSIKTFIAKANDDLRQEVMTMQLIKVFDKVFRENNLKLRLRPYEIQITSSSSGLIEFLPDTISIDGLKKKIISTKYNSLSSFFKFFFDENLLEAQKNFSESLAAYSLVSYLINIKDRHNGNILLDMNGNIIHIDFGFILGISPGGMNFETSPFKLTNEYIEILDGEGSTMFDYYKSLMVIGLTEVKKHYDIFENIILAMASDGNSLMPCFKGRSVREVIRQFRSRFHFGEDEVKVINELVRSASTNLRTGMYDHFQKLTNGILP